MDEHLLDVILDIVRPQGVTVAKEEPTMTAYYCEPCETLFARHDLVETDHDTGTCTLRCPDCDGEPEEIDEGTDQIASAIKRKLLALERMLTEKGHPLRIEDAIVTAVAAVIEQRR